MKFRRQHTIDRFVVDFYCPAARLVIEIDGPVHQQQAFEDRERQDIIEALGFRLIRFTNDQVCNNLERVLAEIARHINSPQAPLEHVGSE